MDPGPVLGPDRSWTGVGKACRRQGLPGRLAGFVSLLLRVFQVPMAHILSMATASTVPLARTIVSSNYMTQPVQHALTLLHDSSVRHRVKAPVHPKRAGRCDGAQL